MHLRERQLPIAADAALVPLGVDVLRRFPGAALEQIDRLERRRLGADEPEHDAFRLRNEAQRREIAGARSVFAFPRAA